MPVSALPEPSSATLKGAPLEQVVWQMRHEPLEASRDVANVLKVRDELVDSYPVIDQFEQSEVMIGPTGANQSNKVGWRIRTDDGSWTVVVMQDFVAIECTGYSTWTEFARRARDLLGAVANNLKPSLAQRVGLRYVDRLSRHDTALPHQWNGLLHPGLLGFATEAPIAPEITAVQTVHTMKFGDDSVLLRSSCAPDTASPAGYSMLLDTDCFDSRARAFSLDDVVETTTRLHGLSLRLFQLAVSVDYMRELTDGA